MRRSILAAGLALLLVGCGGSAPRGAPPLLRPVSAEAASIAGGRGEIHHLPVGDRMIQARLCRPEIAGPVPLVVVNHGSPADAAQRSAMRPGSCDAEVVRWFAARGFAVLLPLRRGYGASGASWAEAYGSCQDADFVRAGRESARDIAAAITYATALPGIRREGVLVAGQSAGGWGALALAAENRPEVAAVLNMAGGRGGWAQGVPNANCRPDRLVSAAAAFGRTTVVPSLWIYTANDSFFGLSLAAEMHRAYAASGAPSRFEALGPWGRDGHDLFFALGGSAVWGPLVDNWLRRHGYAPRELPLASARGGGT